MKKLLFIVFFIPLIAHAQNIFVSYYTTAPACGGGAQTSGCGGQTTMTDARDSKVYNIVQTGTGTGIQCWMAQNLNYGTYVTIATGQGTLGTKYCYGDNTANCTTYGGLYEWANMMNGSTACNGDATCPPCATTVQGLCPAGWHIPSHYEWVLLEKNVGSNPGAFPYDETTMNWGGTNEGGNLKETGTTHWTTPNTGAANTPAFTALPSGDCYAGSFYDVGLFGYWWSATESGTQAWVHGMYYNNAQVMRFLYNKTHGRSVRCVKNCSAPTANAGSAINPACGVTTATLAGNTPSAGTGAWSVVSGTATITTPSSPTSGVTGLAASGSATLRWTISNSPCTASTSDVIITTTDVPAQPSVITGTTPVCQGNSAVAYSVTNVGGVTYTWTYSGTGYTQASGGTTNSITANFSASATSGTLTVIPSNGCGSGTAQTLAITVSATPTVANAGSAINPSCGVTTATLAGNTATVGTGAWSVVSGTATITTPSSPTSGVTGLAQPGTATLRWTISNSPCTASTSDVVITTTCCCCSFTDSRDSKTYNAVLIGTQCWMSQNLNYSTSGSYTPIHGGAQLAGEKYCNKAGNVDDATCAMGGLYEWTNMMNGSATCNGTGAPPNDKCPTNVQGLCPAGWHIPSHYEWTTLEKNVGSNPGAFPYDITTFGWLGTNEGGNLKETGTTHWTTPNTGAANTPAFTALPSGLSTGGSFYNIGTYGFWWSATENSGTSAWRRYLGYVNAQAGRTMDNKPSGFSVRCVKD